MVLLVGYQSLCCWIWKEGICRDDKPVVIQVREGRQVRESVKGMSARFQSGYERKKKSEGRSGNGQTPALFVEEAEDKEVDR
jgi:hypothetical protein